LQRTVSVVIPALNEAALLPGLLTKLGAQTRQPDEIIVADAGSDDGTRHIARQSGCVVVAGGSPAAGRNAGALAASGDILMFLDADVSPPVDFLEKALAEFTGRGCGVAASLVTPLERNPEFLLAVAIVNTYIRATRPFLPHAPGCCIVAHRDVHAAIGGFDESVQLAEDHDYARRALEAGQFQLLSSVRMPVSMRRIAREGLARVAVKYVWCEMEMMRGRSILTTPFEYQYGAFGGRGPAGVATGSVRRAVSQRVKTYERHALLTKGADQSTDGRRGSVGPAVHEDDRPAAVVLATQHDRLDQPIRVASPSPVAGVDVPADMAVAER
jgi:glycosyltransferase involved in cell wall biosynthesis